MLGLGVPLRGEQQLAAPELHLAHIGIVRILRHDTIERRQRQRILPGGVIGPSQLIEHLVVAGIVRVGLEQHGVQSDRLGTLGVKLRYFARHALNLAGLDVQVAEAT